MSPTKHRFVISLRDLSISINQYIGIIIFDVDRYLSRGDFHFNHSLKMSFNVLHRAHADLHTFGRWDFAASSCGQSVTYDFCLLKIDNGFRSINLSALLHSVLRIADEKERDILLWVHGPWICNDELAKTEHGKLFPLAPQRAGRDRFAHRQINR